MHAHSRVAARYARAAAQLGKVEPVEQALFQNQEKWEQNGDVDGTVAAVLSAAEMTKVRALVKGGTLEAAIDKDYALGQTYRVNQTLLRFSIAKVRRTLLRWHDLRHSQAVSRSAALTE